MNPLLVNLDIRSSFKNGAQKGIAFEKTFKFLQNEAKMCKNEAKTLGLQKENKFFRIY